MTKLYVKCPKCKTETDACFCLDPTITGDIRFDCDVCKHSFLLFEDKQEVMK